MSQNLLLTKVSGRYGTALFGVAKVVAERYRAKKHKNGKMFAEQTLIYML